MPKIAMCSSSMIMADWLDAFKAAARNDFDAFEITCVFPSADPHSIKPEALDEAREILRQMPMEICVHAPFFEINIAAYSKAIREASISITKAAFVNKLRKNEETLKKKYKCNAVKFQVVTKEDNVILKPIPIK